MDILAATESDFDVVPFTKENNFHPPNADYFRRSDGSDSGSGDGNGASNGAYEGLLMPVLSNPSNPTGHTRSGAELEVSIAAYSALLNFYPPVPSPNTHTHTPTADHCVLTPTPYPSSIFRMWTWAHGHPYPVNPRTTGTHSNGGKR